MRADTHDPSSATSRKQPQLTASAGGFTLQPRRRQSSLLPGAFDDLRRDGLNLCRNPAQELAAFASGNAAVDGKCLRRKADRKFDLFRSCRDKSRLQALSIARIRGVKRFCRPSPSRKPMIDLPERFAIKTHFRLCSA